MFCVIHINFLNKKVFKLKEKILVLFWQTRTQSISPKTRQNLLNVLSAYSWLPLHLIRVGLG
jgi:hypothetical protein